jgi:retron-type reverse transcriptase
VSWREFLRNKKKKGDTIRFSLHFIDNIFSLHEDLKNRTYKHGGYKAFKINDPKPRDIHKARVRDRLLHHALYRILYPYFDKKFIHDSYSCRIDKGTHRAISRFRDFSRKVSNNNTKQCWVLKCDIRKFFASIDHQTLKNILAKHIGDKDVLNLLNQVINSFVSIYTIADMKKGLPLGNLTSQLLVNIYMNDFDHFVKRELKVKYYIRYADDFVILNNSKNDLDKLLPRISEFLTKELKLSLHPDKVSISTFASGVDFLGWVSFPSHRVLRTSTKNRMFKKFEGELKEETVASYTGLLSHGNAHRLSNRLLKDVIM